jgi:acetyltransferase-like isoleucine patch superfamily enzyme/glycosyltransferase involved in cell wall biosynthesis
MRCTILSELPQPYGRSGWPWTFEASSLPDNMPDGGPWPRISIVTPSYNQGQFIEETIRSVLLQGYPNLEYIIIDAESSDGSVEIIRKYERYLDYWASEPDSGQSHAINKGFSKASGEILGWLNSDDLLAPGALRNIAEAFDSEKDSPIHWIVGKMAIFKQNDIGQVVRIKEPGFPDLLEDWLLESWFAPQPSTFWSRHAWEQAGPLREDLHYSFDREYWMRLRFLGHRPQVLPFILSNFRLHNRSKTLTRNIIFIRERNQIRAEYAQKVPDPIVRQRVILLMKRVDQRLRLSRINASPGFRSLSELVGMLILSPILLFHRQIWRSLTLALLGCVRSASNHIHGLIGFQPRFRPLLTRGMLHFLWWLTRDWEGVLPLRFRRVLCRNLFAKVGRNVVVRAGVTIYDGKDLRVGDNVSIGGGTYISGGPVEIGNDVRIARSVHIETYNHRFDRIDIPIRLQEGCNEPVLIENDVWIGARVTICPGVRVGRGSVVGAASVVTSNLPPYSVAVGCPARVVRSRMMIESKVNAEEP